MARKSRLLQVLYLAEDLLLFFNDYFKSTSWVYQHSGMSRQSKLEAKKYLRQKGIIKPDFSLNLPEKSIYRLITQPWDEKWRMVNFDIPEKNRNIRDKLRYSLGQIGFKSLQRSLWISPLALDSFIEKIRKNIDNPNYLVVLVGSLKSQSSKDLVQRLWNLDYWEDRANTLIEKIGEKESNAQAIKKEFWDLILDHPKVPLALLPNNWPLNRLASRFVEVNKIDG